MADASGSTAVAAPPPAASPQRTLLQLHSLDLSSRADSGNSMLSQGSTSGASETVGAAAGGATLTSLPARSASVDLEGASSHDSHDSDKLATGVPPVKKEDARSSALKALAGVSAIVSKSRKVDAEALQAIKSQRAKARAEGHVPGAGALLASAPSGNLGRVTPPPGAAVVDTGTGISPFASATSQGLVRSPSGSNLSLGVGLGGGGGSGLGGGLGHAASLPVPMHGGPGSGSGGARSMRRSPAGTPPSSSTDYDSLVAKMTITELVALKQAVEAQLAKQAMALAQLQASSSANASHSSDMLSQQYAALLLQNAQQAQLVQQLSSQQQAAHAAAIQQALSAAASAAGISSPTFSPEQLLLAPAAQGGRGGGGAPMAQYASMPLPDMSSPFASAAYPPEAGFGLADGPRGSVTLPAKPSGSPRSASAEQQLIGEALHSFVDPERQGPPSRQGSALVNGINWSDRRASGALPPQAPSSAFSRSRSLPHGPQEGLYHDRSASLNQYLGGDSDSQQLPSLFNGLALGEGGSPPPGAFAGGRSGNLQTPMRHGGHHHAGALPMPPTHLSPTAHQVSFNSSVQTRTFQSGGY